MENYKFEFIDFPKDILVFIFQYLNAPTLIHKISILNKKLNKISKDWKIWRSYCINTCPISRGKINKKHKIYST